MSTIVPNDAYMMGLNDQGDFTMGANELGQNPQFVIDQAGRRFLPYQPAFETSISSDLNIALVNQTTIKFSKVIENIGNHYNPDNGIFTAPVKGFYQFHASLFIENLYQDIQLGTGISTILQVAQRAYRTICQLGTSQGSTGITCAISNMVSMNASDTASVIIKYALLDNTNPLRIKVSTYPHESTSFFSGYFLG